MNDFKDEGLLDDDIVKQMNLAEEEINQEDNEGEINDEPEIKKEENIDGTNKGTEQD